jgi:hypothetical protein
LKAYQNSLRQANFLSKKSKEYSPLITIFNWQAFKYIPKFEKVVIPLIGVSEEIVRNGFYLKKL